jgi:hypothetical protein
MRKKGTANQNKESNNKKSIKHHKRQQKTKRPKLHGKTNKQADRKYNMNKHHR